MKYRNEIDGLRALAVLPVILFHAGFKAFEGGFVGVDVFFVISGYLITTIILTDMNNQNFSIGSFYERRARRILPALFFVMLCCLPFAWLWLLPDQFKDFSESLAAVSVFSSNILFWKESGYFGVALELKPLLHTWSLAVEEQYYVLFPLFLMALWKLRKRWIFGSLVMVGGISLLAAQWGAYNKPSATFFLLPTRAWELAIGALIAFYFLYKKEHAEFICSRKKTSEALGLFGLILILYSIFAFDKTTPFPSLYALIPTIGAGLIIVFATPDTVVGRFLSIKPLVSIGLISYSTYLWHQPVFVFARLISPTELGTVLLLVLSLLSILLAYVSWRFVEGPFRDKQKFSRIEIFRFSIIGSVFFAVVGISGHINNGFEEVRESTPDSSINDLIPNKNVHGTMLLGDSHASHLNYGLSALLATGVVDRSYAGCIPFQNVDRYDYRFVPGTCAEKMNSGLEEFVSSTSLKNLILSTMGPVYLDGTPFRGNDKNRVTGLGVELIDQPEITDKWHVFEIGMKRTLDYLTRFKEKNIVFIIDVPELGIDYGGYMPKKELKILGLSLTDMTTSINLNESRIPRAEFDKRVGRYHKLIYEVLRDYPEVKVFDPTDMFCDQDWCHGYKQEVGYLYRDADHLSNEGSVYVALQILLLLK